MTFFMIDKNDTFFLIEKIGKFVHMDHNFGGVVFAIYLNVETYDA